MDLNLAVATTNELLKEHGYYDWKTVIDRAKNRLGICRYSRKEIGLSRDFVELNSQEEVLQTILHELAHVIAGPKHNHDWV